MPAFTIQCRCGDQFHADERSIGRRLKCRRCGRTLIVRRPRTSLRAQLREAPAVVKGRAALSSIWQRMRRRRRGSGWRRRRRPRSRTVRPLARPVAILSWTYLAAVCAIAIVMWTLGDRWWVATVFLYMGRWVFLLPLALLAPAAAALSWRSLVPLAAAALVAAVPIMGFRTGWRWPRSVPNGAHVRIVTFNVDGGAALLGQLPRLLEEWGPDVVAFQECGPALAEETRRVPGWYHHDVNGLCLLSRFPIRDARVMDRAALEVVKQSGTGIGGAGLVARYTLQFPLGVIQFTNLHLETPRKGFEGLMALDVNQLRQNSALRDIESDLARKWVDQGVAGQATPFLVAGDFNTPVESRILRDHWSDLANAFSQAGSGLGVTKYNGWIRIRIDHVLLGPSWRAVRVNVGRHLGSDHRPLIADLTLVGTG